jgi:hypothetical protein
VPIDDDHMMFWSFNVPSTRQGGLGQGNRTAAAGSGGAIEATARARDGNAQEPQQAAQRQAFEYVPATSGWLGKFRLTQNRDNDYGIDREAQKRDSYTGIPGIHQQDQAITESMGTIYPRTSEHLGTSDAMVIRTRRRLINAAKALARDGTMPPGVDDPTVYRYRSGGVILPRSADWLEATKDLRKAFMSHKPEELYEPVLR